MKAGNGRRRATKAWVTALIAFQGVASAGCSFVYTKGPRPDLHPPPPCTTSNDAPIADTVLAAASVGAIVGGLILANHTTDCGGFPCGVANGLTGDGIIILGAVGTLIFIPSAGVGYSRTAACRDWLEGGAKLVPATPARPGQAHGSRLLVPASLCSTPGDAPLLCAKGSLRE